MSLPKQVTDRIQLWESKPEELNVMHLNSEGTMRWAALWCGGAISDNGDEAELLVPTLTGVGIARKGDYLVQEIETRQFHISNADVLGEGYSRVYYEPEPGEPIEDLEPDPLPEEP